MTGAVFVRGCRVLFAKSKMVEMETFWLQTGLTPTHSRRLSALQDSAFGNLELAKERLSSIERILGIGKFEAARMVCKYPKLLISRVSTIERKKNELIELLGKAALICIFRNPRLLNRDIHTTITKNLENLKKNLPNVDVVSIVKRQPDVICRRPQTISASIRFLKSLLQLDDVSAIITAQPSLLSVDMEHSLLPKYSKLQQLLGSVNTREIVIRHPSLLWSDMEHTLPSKLWFLSHYMSIDHVSSMVSRDPRVLTRSFSVLTRLEFLHVHFPRLTLSPNYILTLPLTAFLSKFPTYRNFVLQRLHIVDLQHRPLLELNLLPTTELLYALNASLKRIVHPKEQTTVAHPPQFEYPPQL